MPEPYVQTRGRAPSRDGSVRDNTLTTTGTSTRSTSSMRMDKRVGFRLVDGMQSVRKVEGLVVRLDRGSSNLPGRISHVARRWRRRGRHGTTRWTELADRPDAQSTDG